MHIRDDGWGSRIVPLGGSLKSRASCGWAEGAERQSGIQRNKGASAQVCRHLADLEASRQSNTWRFIMKMIKSLVLGSAAGLLAMGGGQAGGLPAQGKGRGH